MSSANRANATTLEVTADAIRSRDGYDVRVTVRLPVRLHESSIDRAAFAKAVGDGRTVDGSAERIVKLVEESVQKALAAAADGDAEELLASAAGFAEAAASAARGPLFAAGLMLDGDATATVDAPTLRQRQAEQAAADAARTAADRADDLLRRFEDIRRQSPDVPPGRLLMALPPEDRRDALLKLFEAAGSQPRKLLLAAGINLYELDPPRHLRAAPALIDPNDADVGPYRCVRHVETGGALNLLFGARDGVVLTSTAHVTLNRDFAKGKVLRSPESRRFGHAFSSVTLAPPRGGSRDIWASHRELGLQVWGAPMSADADWRDRGRKVLSETELRVALNELLGTSSQASPADVFPSKPVWVSAMGPWKWDDRSGVAVCVTDGISRSALIGVALRSEAVATSTFDFSLEASLDEPIIEMFAVNDRHLTAISTGGTLLRITQERGDALVHQTTIVPRPVTAAAAVPWLGDVRVAACVADGPVVVAGPDDDVRVEYRSEHKGFAAVAASGGRLAAVTGDRTRVVVWNLHEPERPVLDLYVLGDTRSRVADVAFL